MRRYSESIAAALNNFLTKDNWKFFFDKEKGIFCFGLSISSKIKKVQYYVQVRQEDYKVCAVSPIGAEADDHEQMAKMAEFVCRANYGLNNGNFELDLRDGEIRYKCYVDCAGSIQPTEDVVRNSIYCPAMMFEKYAPGIVDIIFGDLSAKEAVDKCEDAGTQTEYRQKGSASVQTLWKLWFRRSGNRGRTGAAGSRSGGSGKTGRSGRFGGSG